MRNGAFLSLSRARRILRDRLCATLGETRTSGGSEGVNLFASLRRLSLLRMCGYFAAGISSNGVTFLTVCSMRW